jgi:hypothetical protein
LSLSFLLIAASNGFRTAAAYAQVDISIFDYYNDNGIYTAVMSGIIFDAFKGNLLDFTAPFEHAVEIDADQIFPNETLKREIISQTGPLEFAMPNLNYDVMGFNISATDIEVDARAKQITDDNSQSQKTRIDFPVMLAKNVNVSNEITSRSFKNVDLSSIYAIYDPKTDKFTFHVPFEIAARYLLAGS